MLQLKRAGKLMELQHFFQENDQEVATYATFETFCPRHE